MRAVKTYVEVGSDKSLILKSLPFAPGSRVEVSEKIAWGPSISDGNVQIWEGEFSGYRGRGQLPVSERPMIFNKLHPFKWYSL
jgi:hypothetical protein